MKRTGSTMTFQYRLDYSILTDKQIFAKILAEPHDEEAAVYLLHDRYAPLLRSLYRRITTEDTWYDDCVDELFILLKGKDCSWHILASFGWRSTFGYWLREVAWNKFCEVLPKLLENGGKNVSIDNDNTEKRKVQLIDDGEENNERRQRKVMLLEAIGHLNDDDQRFAILKRLEGYKSKEIAEMLKIKWKKLGIVKYNKYNEVVIPDEGYINVHVQRAKKELKIIMSN